MRTQARIWPPDGRPRAPTIWTPWSRNWRRARPSVPTKTGMGSSPSAPGTALPAVFRDLGVDGIISGGSDHENPSTESILNEINRTTPRRWYSSWPNNKNIIMAAQQCVGLAEGREVIVVPTATIPQGVTAMMNVDLDAATGGHPRRHDHRH